MLSRAVAFITVEFIVLAIYEYAKYIHSLTLSERTSIIVIGMLNSISSGRIILENDDLNSSNPTSIIRKATISEEIYSNLPCP